MHKDKQNYMDFFLFQEPRADKDDDNCKRINELLNNPSSAVQSAQSPDQDLQSLFNNMSQSQLMQLFGSGVGQMGGLSNLLGTMRGPNSGSARTSTTPAITHRTTTAPSTPTTTSSIQSTPAPTTPQVTSAPSTAAAAVPPPMIQLADLQNYLQGIAPTSSASPQQSGKILFLIVNCSLHKYALI